MNLFFSSFIRCTLFSALVDKMSLWRIVHLISKGIVFLSHKLFPAHFKVFQSFCVKVFFYTVILLSICIPLLRELNLMNLFFFWMLFSFLFALLCTLLINHYEITETKHINTLKSRRKKAKKKHIDKKMGIGMTWNGFGENGK